MILVAGLVLLMGARPQMRHVPAPGNSWQYVGPNAMSVPYRTDFGIGPISGRVNAVAFDPNNSQIIYAGGADGGLWKSTNGGSTWNWLSATWNHIAVNCIAIDPTNSSVVYVGLGDYHGMIAGSYGIMKTTNGGGSWTEIATASMGQIGVPKILIDPTSDQILIAGTGDVNSYGKLYRSTNAGATWVSVSPTGSSDCMWPTLAASDPVGTTVRLYAVAGGTAEADGASSRVYASDDHGASWQFLPSPVSTDGTFHLAYAITASPTNSNNVYVLDSEHQAFFTSTDQGVNWTDLSADLPTGDSVSPNYNFSQSSYAYHLECGTRVVGTTSNDLLFLGEVDLNESLDGGVTWSSLGGPSYSAGALVHNNQHNLAICPEDANVSIFSNDGGVYSLSFSSATNQNTVTSLNQNLGVTAFTKIATHPTNANILLGGAENNASPYTSGNLSDWFTVGGPSGGGTAINQTDPAIQYTTAAGPVVYRTSDGWSTHELISPVTLPSENLPTVPVLTLAPQDQTKLYTGTNYLYQFDDSTQQWTNRLGNTNLAGSSVIQAIAVAPTDVTRIYVGAGDGELWMSTDTGSTWVSLSAGSTLLPNAPVTSISVSGTDSSDILIGYGGMGTAGAPEAHLWRCTNTQATNLAFSSVSSIGASGLPDLPLNAIARDVFTPASSWWVGTDLGVFYTANSGGTWTNAGAPLGLPNVAVKDLVSNASTSYLTAATGGMGVWRLLLTSQNELLSNFVLSPTSTRGGNLVQATVTLTSPAPSGGASVTISSSNPLLASVPASVTIPTGSNTATFEVTTFASDAPGTATITATYGGASLSQNLTVTLPTLSGTVTFGDYVGPAHRSVTLYLRHTGATGPFMTKSVSIDASGNFVAEGLPAEAYTVYIQTGTWLRRSMFVDLTSVDVSGASFVLINGDVNGDNRINLADIRAVASALGSQPGQANWNINADLNGDGQVNGEDLAILYKNYGKIGDP